MEEKRPTKASFSGRERVLLRLMAWESRLGDAWMRFRYKDRVEFGPGCRVDWRTLVVHGPGRVRLGEGVLIERGVHKVLFHLEPESEVSLGRGTWIQTFDSGVVFSCKKGAAIEIGDGCWFSGGIFGASKKITVGERTLIGWGCQILDSHLHRMDNSSPAVEAKPVHIGSHVWMPSYITVFPGVRIGDHCVIGTGSLVTEDIPDYSFAAGRPARVIKKLAPRDRVE